MGRLLVQVYHTLRRVIGDAACGGRIDAADQIEHRCLASTVGPDQRKYLTTPYIEAHIIDGFDTTELHREMAHCE